MIGYEESETLRLFRRSADIAIDYVSGGWLDKTNFVRMQVLLTNYFTFRLRCTTAWKVRPFSSSLDSVHRFERGYFLSMFIKSKFPVKDLSTFRYLTHCLEKQFIERAPSR